MPVQNARDCWFGSRLASVLLNKHRSASRNNLQPWRAVINADNPCYARPSYEAFSFPIQPQPSAILPLFQGWGVHESETRLAGIAAHVADNAPPHGWQQS